MMEKHTCELKDTIEYKMLHKVYYPLIYIIFIILVCFLGLYIYIFLALPFAIAIFVFIVLLIFCCLILSLPTHILLSELKEKRTLSINYDSYEEVEATLSIPIKVRGNGVKFMINVKLNDGNEKQLESHIYSESLITSKRMLIGYNLTTKDVIFLKNI